MAAGAGSATPPGFAAICCIPERESWNNNRLILIFFVFARALARSLRLMLRSPGRIGSVDGRPPASLDPAAI
jgi:hypothetical protein